jgi:glutamate racemase
LQGVLGYVMGEGVNLVSSADETAKDVFRVLTEHDLLAPAGNRAKYDFFATGDEQEFGLLARRFLGPEVTKVQHLERKSIND